jgi:hypothetical protein
MKVLYTLLISLFLVTGGYAQDEETYILTNIKGIPILPVEGDVGFGIGADPFFTYFGNFFSGDSVNRLEFNEPYFHLRYFVSDMEAIRIKLGLGLNNDLRKVYVRDDFAAINDTLSTKKTIDQQNLVANSFFIDFGYQARKGQTRLQGFFGGGFRVAYANSKQNYTYGNPYSTLNTSPTSYDFPGYGNILSYGRVVENSEGSVWSFGLNMFAGVEYFFLPKASIGTQADLSVLYSLKGKQSRETEVWGNDKSTNITEVLSPGGRSFNTFTAHTNMNLFLMFHF